jgi:hypothetical protein
MVLASVRPREQADVFCIPMMYELTVVSGFLPSSCSLFDWRVVPSSAADLYCSHLFGVRVCSSGSSSFSFHGLSLTSCKDVAGSSTIEPVDISIGFSSTRSSKVTFQLDQTPPIPAQTISDKHRISTPAPPGADDEEDIEEEEPECALINAGDGAAPFSHLPVFSRTTMKSARSCSRWQ